MTVDWRLVELQLEFPEAPPIYINFFLIESELIGLVIHKTNSFTLCLD